MTRNEFINKFTELYLEWRDSVRCMSLYQLKQFIKNAPKRAVLHELELNHRINGGDPPLTIIVNKMAKQVTGIVSVTAKMSLELEIITK